MYSFPEIKRLFNLQSEKASRMVNRGILAKNSGVYGSRGNTHVDFLTLVELLVASEMRSKGVSAQEIRKVREAYISKGFKHPLADSRFCTDGKKVFMDDNGDLHEAYSKQRVFREVMKGMMKKIGYSEKYHLAEKYYPFHKKTIVIDPKYAFGAPSIAGTRIKTSSLYAYFRSGWKKERIAEEWDISLTKVNDAIEFEEHLSQKTAA